MQNQLRFLYLCCFVFIAFSCHVCFGQQTALPIDEWMESLSVKNDIRSERLRGVVAEIRALDSVAWCSALTQLQQKHDEGNARCKIRILLVTFAVSEYRHYCMPVNITDDVYQAALRSAYELEDDLLLYELHSIGTSLYYERTDFGRVILHGRLANGLVEKLGRQNVYRWSSYLFNFVYGLYYGREYEECIRMSLDLVRPDAKPNVYDDTLRINFRLNTWNMVGLCYAKLHQPDSAFLAFDKALEVAGKDPFWEALINGNKADILYTQGKYDTARLMLMHDYEQSMIIHETGNAGNSLQWVGRIDLHQGKTEQAYKTILQAKSLVAKQYKPEYMANVLFALSSAYARLGKNDSAEFILNQYLALHDSIEHVASNNRSSIVEMQMENLANVHTIGELNKSRRRSALIRNFSIGLVLLFALTGYLYMSRKQLRLRMRQQVALEAQSNAEREVTVAKQQLEVYTQHILEKTKLVDDLQVQLSEFDTSESQQEKISKLSRHVILTEADWDNFKKLFEKVYPAFFDTLKLQFPDITLAEQRMAALVKLQLSIKESADLLGISTNSVYKNRERLRIRLGLEDDAALTLYFT